MATTKKAKLTKPEHIGRMFAVVRMAYEAACDLEAESVDLDGSGLECGEGSPMYMATWSHFVKLVGKSNANLAWDTYQALLTRDSNYYSSCNPDGE